MSFLVPLADSYQWVFLREPVAPSIQGTVLVIGQPGDILQAAARGNATIPAGSQHRLDADPWVVDARAGMCQRATHITPCCPLHFLGLPRGYIFLTLFFALSPCWNCKVNLSGLSRECHSSQDASEQMDPSLLSHVCISKPKWVAKHLWIWLR